MRGRAAEVGKWRGQRPVESYETTGLTDPRRIAALGVFTEHNGSV